MTNSSSNPDIVGRPPWKVLAAENQAIHYIPIGVFFLDVLWLLRDPNRQALHDKLAGSIVVSKERAIRLIERRKQQRF